MITDDCYYCNGKGCEACEWTKNCTSCKGKGCLNCITKKTYKHILIDRNGNVILVADDNGYRAGVGIKYISYAKQMFEFHSVVNKNAIWKQYDN